MPFAVVLQSYVYGGMLVSMMLVTWLCADRKADDEPFVFNEGELLAILISAIVWPAVLVMFVLGIGKFGRRK